MTSRRRIKTRRIERHADHCVGWESIRSGGEEVEGEGAVEVVLDIGGYQCMLPGNPNRIVPKRRPVFEQWPGICYTADREIQDIEVGLRHGSRLDVRQIQTRPPTIIASLYREGFHSFQTTNDNSVGALHCVDSRETIGIFTG